MTIPLMQSRLSSLLFVAATVLIPLPSMAVPPLQVLPNDINAPQRFFEAGREQLEQEICRLLDDCAAHPIVSLQIQGNVKLKAYPGLPELESLDSAAASGTTAAPIPSFNLFPIRVELMKRVACPDARGPGTP